MLNWDLMKNPINWVIVALMCLFAVFGLNLLLGQPEQM